MVQLAAENQMSQQPCVKLVKLRRFCCLLWDVHRASALCRLRKLVSSMEGEKSVLERNRASLEKEAATLSENLSMAQASARRDAESMAARGSQTAADISR